MDTSEEFEEMWKRSGTKWRPKDRWELGRIMYDKYGKLWNAQTKSWEKKEREGK